MKITETKDGSLLEIFVKPRSKAFKLAVEGDDVLIFCREEPTKGKVNKELIKELSRLFHTKVELATGFSSKNKTLLIRGISKTEAEQILQQHVDKTR